MTAFVLVHGAWEGGWCWSRVAPLLRAAGHEVFAPTLTGLGERAHLLSPGVGLETHIADVLGVLRCERLEDIVLVGHSYGGMVVTGTADRAAERIRALVYLDAALPENGQSMLDLIPPERRAQFLESARREGEGWKVPPLPAERWGIADPDDRDWVDSLCGFHPLKTFQDPIALTGRHDAIADKVYVLAEKYAPSPFHAFAARVRGKSGWTSYGLPTWHFTMLQMPRETADVLLRHA